MTRLLARIPRPAARWTRVLLLASLAGVTAGLAAAALEYALHLGSHNLVGRFTHLGDAGILDFRLGILLLPAMGGLGAGLAVRWFSPKLGGHGTDLLIRAFHHRGGVMPLRGPAANAAAAVSVISCGGSAGPEGPIAALGAAIGSSLGRVFALTPRERRIMLVAGCGAGVGAIFQCPLGGALFAASVLYKESDFETDAVVPAFVASVLGYSAYMSFWGYGALLLRDAEKLAFTSPAELIPFAVLGPLCGLMCAVLRGSIRTAESLAAKFGRYGWLAPMLGGLATGGLACLLPQVMDGQYVFVQHALDGGFRDGLASRSWLAWSMLFGAVAVAKCVATGLTVGSGAPGGVLGPSVFIGGTLGAFVGALVTAIAPESLTSNPENLRRALIAVGMAGVLSASMRVPLAALVMVAEMTGGYGLIVPLMLVCVTSYVIGRRWGLNDEQVPTSAESPAHAGDFVVHMLEIRKADEIMKCDRGEVISPNATLRELGSRLTPGSRPVFVVQDEGRVTGVVSVPEIERALKTDWTGDLVIAADMMTPDVPILRPDDTLYTALSSMSRTGQLALPVTSGDGEARFLGVVTRADIHKLVRRQLDEMSEYLIAEHAGLAAMDQEDGVYQLASGVSPGTTDRVQRLLVPIQAIGLSLRAADFRRQFGIHVLAIEQPDGTIQCPPDADAPLQTSQRLLAVSSETESPVDPEATPGEGD